MSGVAYVKHRTKGTGQTLTAGEGMDAGQAAGVRIPAPHCPPRLGFLFCKVGMRLPPPHGIAVRTKWVKMW